MSRLVLTLLGVVLLAGCTVASVAPLTVLRQPDGSVVWQDEYAFIPPGGAWELISLDEDDYSLAFSKNCRNFFPCQSTLAYAEEPFGFSDDLMKRQAEFFRRYLWASRVVFDPPQLQETEFAGRPALLATVTGREPVREQKVYGKVLFLQRGERVVAFYYNQWRPEGVPFDAADEADFDRFVASFRFLRPSFYQSL